MRCTKKNLATFKIYSPGVKIGPASGCHKFCIDLYCEKFRYLLVLNRTA